MEKIMRKKLKIPFINLKDRNDRKDTRYLSVRGLHCEVSYDDETKRWKCSYRFFGDTGLKNIGCPDVSSSKTLARAKEMAIAFANANFECNDMPYEAIRKEVIE
jgi:hypothetical protein